jgi:hypothetical protein
MNSRPASPKAASITLDGSGTELNENCVNTPDVSSVPVVAPPSLIDTSE